MIPTFDIANSLLGRGSGSSGDYVVINGATWNPADKTTDVTLSNGDLTYSEPTQTFQAVRTTRNDLNSAGGRKLYFEILVTTIVSGDLYLGFLRTSQAITAGVSVTASGAEMAFFRPAGAARVTVSPWTTAGTVMSFGAGDIVMVAVDEPTGQVYLGANGTWHNSADPAAGTGPSFTGMPSNDFAFCFCTDNNSIGTHEGTLITSTADLNYTVPTGYTAGLP